MPGYDLSTRDKGAVSVLIIRPEQKERICNYFGGRWKALTVPFGEMQDFSPLTSLPILGRRFASQAAQPQMARFQVQVFRRFSDSDGGETANRKTRGDL